METHNERTFIMLNKYIGRITNLGSSSNGNSFFIEVILKNRKPFGILLEAGFNYSKLWEKMNENNISMEDIDVVLISHNHL